MSYADAGVDVSGVSSGTGCTGGRKLRMELSLGSFKSVDNACVGSSMNVSKISRRFVSCKQSARYMRIGTNAVSSVTVMRRICSESSLQNVTTQCGSLERVCKKSYRRLPEIIARWCVRLWWRCVRLERQSACGRSDLSMCLRR